jgi:SSS family solute:Na+ symporter
MHMSLIPFFIVMILSLGASYLAARKKTDYFLADRSLRWPMLIGTFLGAQIGGGFILGNTEVAFHHGYYGSMYGLGIAIGLALLGMGFGERLRALQATTLPEILRQRYGSVAFQRIAGIVSILSLAGGLLCQAIALKKFILSLGFEGHTPYLLAWSMLVLYTTMGGLLAVVWTDTLQALIMIGMLVITFGATLAFHMPTIITEASLMDHQLTGISVSSLLFPLCFIFVQQDMAQRCFAAKTSTDVRIGCWASAIGLVILTGIPTVCGILGHAMHLSPDNGAIFLQVIGRIGGQTMFVIAASAVLLAIVSTASAILLALSSNVAHDVVGKRKGHIVTLMAGGIAALGPYISDDIIGGLVLSYEISVGALLIPIIAAVMTKKEKLPTEAALGAAILGLLGTVFSRWMHMSLLGVAAPCLLSPLGFVGGLLLHRFRRRSTEWTPGSAL